MTKPEGGDVVPFAQPMPQRLQILLSTYRFRYTHEVELQDSIEKVLTSAGIEHAREVTLGHQGTIDFVVRGVRPKRTGLEVKIGGATFEVVRQLQRYAAHEDIDAIVLVTPVRRHVMPPELAGKPVTVIRLRPAWL